MDEALAMKVDELYQQKVAARQAARGGKVTTAEDAAQVPQGLKAIAIPGIGSFCKIAGPAIGMVLKLIETFSWLIPDRIEDKVVPVLETILEGVLPAFCPKP